MSARSFVLTKKNQGNIRVDSNDVTGYVGIFLHGHNVATKNESGEIILSSCGWHTPTTKTAINRFLELMGRDERVVQAKGEWTINGQEFKDGMILGTKLDRVLE